jgi:replicative DNA helicase
VSDPEHDQPPQDLDAEEYVLAAVLSGGSVGESAPVVAALRASGLQPSEFYKPSHGTMLATIYRMDEAGETVDALTFSAALEAAGQLEKVDGKARVHELAALTPATANVGHWARLVRSAAERREERAVARAIEAAAWNGGVAAHPELAERLRRLVDHGRQADHADRIADGRTFAFSKSSATGQLWGGAWVEGEGTMFCAPQGVGKTTLAQRVGLARIGIGTHVLGMPVARTEAPVLYVAADRPNQAARSLARMVDEDTHGDRLAELLRVWRGPLPFDVLDEPTRLAGFARTHGAETLILDTLHAIAPDLARDETGSRLNLAFQSVVASGIELLVCHHQRKAQADNKKPTTLDDVYGSTFLTAGLGSVVLLWGKPGDPIVELRHLKQPAEEVGPFTVTIDHDTGQLAVTEATNLRDLLATTPEGLTAQTAATNLAGTSEPSPADVEKARRKLNKLEEEGDAKRVPDTNPTVYVLAR